MAMVIRESYTAFMAPFTEYSPQERALAAAVRSDQGNQLAARQPERNIVDDQLATAAQRYMIDNQMMPRMDFR